jgi:hypothetical protein
LAKSGLKHIDVGPELTKTEWESEESHELLHGSSFPGSPVERQLFYRDDEHKWYIYNGTGWVWLGGGGGMSVHGNEYHDPDFAEASHTHSDLSPAHKDITTGVHGVGAGTVAKVGDIAVDSNLSAAAQDAIAKKHTQGTDTALGAVGTKNPPIDADKALYRNSESSDALVTSTWTQIKAFFKTYFDTLYATISHTHSQLHDRQHAITSTSDHSSSATSGRMLKADANGLPVNATNTDTEVADAVDKKHSKVITLTFIIDGGGSAITTGQKGHLELPFACTITGWTLLADQSGSIVIDVWKDTYANFPPTVADTIAGSEKPTLSSAQKNQDLTLTTWTTSVAAGDILAFNVDSVSTVTRVTLSIRAEKS